MMLPLQIEPMTPADITQVISFEKAAYGERWSCPDYEHELHKNHLAHHFILRLSQPPPPSLIGHAGFWRLAGELHVSTIAIHPDWQGLGLGEWLLAHLIEQGQTLQATLATLEVRASNQAAISLYQKYDFQEVGRRLRYYNDGEDALILTTPELTAPDYQAMLARHKTTLRQRLQKLRKTIQARPARFQKSSW